MVTAVVAACGATVLSTYRSDVLWDFNSYYHAVLAHSMGFDPYDVRQVNDAVSPVRPIQSYLAYPYHPLTLWFFRPFTWVGFNAARFFYLSANVVAAGLFAWTVFPFIMSRSGGLRLPTAAAFIVSFGFPFLLACQSGNPAIFEALAIWAALRFASQGSCRLTVSTLIAVSLFKLTPLLLIPPALLVSRSRTPVLTGMWSYLLFGILFLSPGLYAPECFRSYLEYLGRISSESFSNFSSLVLAQRIASDLGKPSWSYIFYATFVVSVLVPLILATMRRMHVDDAHRFLMLTLVSYALVLPRLKDYGLISLLPFAAWMAEMSPTTLFVSSLSLWPLPAPLFTDFAPLWSLYFLWAWLLGAAASQPRTKSLLFGS